MNPDLLDFGLVPFFSQQLSLEELEPGRAGRVIEVQRSGVTVFDGDDEHHRPLASALLEAAPEARPTVGDWVVMSDSQVERVLERKSLFRRLAAGERSVVQLIAANIDVLFVVTSCNEEFKESRLERYLALAAEAGVIPVVVLTKADLSDETDDFVSRARSVQPDLNVELVNALDDGTFPGVRSWIDPGSTVALVGSSGVGKSTILNTLAGNELALTGGIREDDKKGRHTTTHRALYRLRDGGLVIDVPGMRELKLADVDDGLASVFDDIEALASRCRFADCQHESEPGCAVRDALERGDLDLRRLNNYRRLQRENARNSASVAENRSQDRAFAKHVRQVIGQKQRDKHSRN